MGHQVSVVTSDRYYPFPEYSSTAYKALGDRIIGEGTDTKHGFQIIRLKTVFEIGTKVFLKGLFKVIVDLNPDLLICHGLDNFNAIRIIKCKKFVGFKLIYDDHTIFPDGKVSTLRRLYYRLFPFENISNNADRVIAVSAPIVQFISTYFRIPIECIELIPLGVDTDIFCFSAESRKRIRARYNISETEFVLIYTGKVIESKGISVILQALSGMNNLCFLCVGNGNTDFKKHLQDQANNYGIRLILNDAVSHEELAGFFSAADVAAWPVGVTISTIEAMSCSLPIICVNDLKERFDEGNGFGINSGDVKELRNKIEYLIQHPVERIQMGKKSRQLTESRFAWFKIAQKFIDP